MKDEKKFFNLLLLFLLFLIISGIYFVIGGSKKVTTNSVPTVDSVTISDTSGGGAISSVNLVELSTTSVYVHGSISDSDYCSDIIDNGGLNVSFYRSGIGSSQCNNMNDSDPENCYFENVSSTCSITNCTTSSTNASYQCEVAPYFFADNTTNDYADQNWQALVEVGDGVASSTASSSVEINELLAIDITTVNSDTVIDYGNLSLGATSSEIIFDVRNSGNDPNTDLDISGQDMGCGSGSIPANNQKFATSSKTYADLDYYLSSAGQALDVDLDKQHSVSGLSSLSTYWKLKVPNSGIGGNCQGGFTFSSL